MASRKTRLARRILFMCLFIALIYGGVIGFNRFIGGKILAAMASMPAPTVSVSVTRAQTRTWPDELEAVGSLSAEQGTTLTAESSGTVTALHFESGQTVKQGQLLVQLNDNTARAQLIADQARQLNAKQAIERQRRLFKRKATSEAALQDAEAAYAEAQAAVQVDRARLANLQVRAPFDGHLGLRRVSLGQYVSPGTSVVDIQQWNPLRVDFDLPQRDLSRIAQDDAISLVVSGLPGQVFSGRVTAFGSTVNTQTRTLTAQALIQNENARLRPGMFGEVTIRLAKQLNVVTLPRMALTYNTYGEYVYVIEDTPKGKVAQQRTVKVGVSRGDEVAILQGIKAGETVVIAGQINLYPGARVKVVAPPQGLNATAHANTGS